MNTSFPSQPETLSARGVDASISLAQGQIRIHRSGVLGLLITVFGQGDGLGEKTIPVRSLSSIEIVRTFVLGIFCFEYMRFSYAGAPERGGSAWRDVMLENVVVMGLFDNRDFYAFKDAVEREIDEARRIGLPPDGGLLQPAPQTLPDPEPSPVSTREPWVARAGRGAARLYGGVVRWGRARPQRWKIASATALVVVLVLGGLLLYRSGGPGMVASWRTDNVLSSLPGSRRQLSWDMGDGLVYRASLPGRALNEFSEFNQAWMAGLQTRLDAGFRERLKLELDPVFVEVDARIPEYGEWVFNWWTSYILMVRGVGAIFDQMASTEEASLERVVERVMADAIKERYVEIVLPPDRFRPALQRAVFRATAETAQELRQACLEMQTRLLTLLLEQKAEVELRAPDGSWVPDRNWQARLADGTYCGASGRQVNLSAADLQSVAASTFGDTGAIDDVAMRVTRPAVTTIVSASLSASSLAAIATGIGIPAALVATPAMAAVLTKSAFTLIDLMLSQLDEAFNRTTFEAVVHDAVRQARSEFELVAQRTLREAVERELPGVGLGSLKPAGRPPA